MIETAAISAIGVDNAGPGAGPVITRLGLDPAAIPQSPVPPQSFASVLESGMDAVNGKLANANDLVRQFAVDDNVPLHRVTMALEEARLSLELAMQVRQRLVESYREIMNMQL